MKNIVFLALVFSQSLFALETDQFHAASHALKDSSDLINEYINDKFEAAINNSNNKKKNLSCTELADDVMTGIVGKFSISKISQFAKHSPEIERYPDDSISSSEYLNNSIYGELGLPFTVVKISRTINIGGVYIGTDKLGHFALLGRNYYRHYQKDIKSGLTKTEAEKNAIFNGLKTEVRVLGYTLGGVLSYGDLEANFQGLQFGLSMCEGANPYLIKEQGLWMRNPKRSFDIKNYINPKMDESYKPAFWKPKIWRTIKPAIKNVYCDLLKNPMYIERVNFYETKISANKNDDYIKEFFSTRPKFDRELENIDKLCDK